MPTSTPPRATDVDAFIKMKRINPNVIVLLASGFMQDERVAALEKMVVSGFIKKPYTMHKLAEIVCAAVHIQKQAVRTS